MGEDKLNADMQEGKLVMRSGNLETLSPQTTLVEGAAFCPRPFQFCIGRAHPSKIEGAMPVHRQDQNNILRVLPPFLLEPLLPNGSGGGVLHTPMVLNLRGCQMVDKLFADT